MLQFGRLSAEDEDKYRCEVENSLGRQTGEVHIKLNQKNGTFNIIVYGQMDVQSLKNSLVATQ